jgi:hypothetical protein
VTLLAKWEEFAEEKKDATINTIAKALTEKTLPVLVSDHSGALVEPLQVGNRAMGDAFFEPISNG